MRCAGCGADLPDGAMFCGECGRSTAAAGLATSASAEFTLRFSTGEIRRVSGSGLIGRRPVAQPGESFDHLVQIADHTMSVSKTHVEFGEHEGELWISDRYSGNGTILKPAGGAAVRCEPGRRYVVPRGTSVVVAEQSFTIE